MYKRIVEAGAKDVWVSEDVELGSLSIGAADKIGLIQLVIAGPVFGPVFIDNIYFYNDPTAGIDDFGKNTFKIFPNPFNNDLTIQMHSKEETLMGLKLFNIIGQLVYMKSSMLNIGENSVNISPGISNFFKTSGYNPYIENLSIFDVAIFASIVLRLC